MAIACEKIIFNTAEDKTKAVGGVQCSSAKI